MSDAFTDVAKMKKIKEEIKAHEGQVVEMTLENGRKRQKNKFGRLIEVYPSLFIIEYTNDNSLPGEPANTLFKTALSPKEKLTSFTVKISVTYQFICETFVF